MLNTKSSMTYTSLPCYTLRVLSTALPLSTRYTSSAGRRPFEEAIVVNSRCHTQPGQEMDQIRLCDIGRRNIGPTVRWVDRVLENSSEVGEKADYPVYQPCKKEEDVFGASRGPRPSADGLVSVTCLAMAGHSRNPRLAWVLFKNQKTI